MNIKHHTVMLKRLIILESVGYESIVDFINNVFARKVVLWIYAIMFSSTIQLLENFIEENVYEPPLGIYILFWITIFDIILGMSKAIKCGRFNHRRLSRAGARFATQVAITAALFQINNVWPVVALWMVDTILLSFVLATLWSVFENAYMLGWIQPSTYILLQRILSVDVILRKFFPEHKKKPKDKVPD